MIPSGQPTRRTVAGLAPGLGALRVRLGLVALLFALTGLAWWWSSAQMQGMDNGPWTSLGTVGWFLGVWVVMMTAMMFPSTAPTIALYSRLTRRRSLCLPLMFTTGYLVTWAGAGLLAFAAAVGSDRLPGDALAWDRAGRWVAGITLLIAAVYELTPLKNACLGKCRSPLGSLLGSWRDGALGALRMGTKNGGWCVGCCGALMASLFALGIMSLVWMAMIAGLITIEKILPWRRPATYGTAAILLGLGVLLLAAPGAIPALTIPGSNPTALQIGQPGP
jgi:predicted metal-binding membrane protein